MSINCKTKIKKMIWIYFILITTSVASASASARDTIFPNQTLKDGDTILSAGGVFEMGFFRFGNPSFRYLGIRYKSIPTANVVWVANRDLPLMDPTGMLKLNDNGTLQLLNVRNNVFWSSEPVGNTSRSRNLVAQLLDSGNLVLKDNTSGSFVWQSFDHPGNTLLPGMKIGLDGVMDKYTNLTSWKTSDDPSTASYIFSVDIANIGYPQLWITEGKSLKQNVGFWNGLGFTGMTPGTMTHPKPSNFCTFDLVLTDKDTVYVVLVEAVTSIRPHPNHVRVYKDLNPRCVKDGLLMIGQVGVSHVS